MANLWSRCIGAIAFAVSFACASLAGAQENAPPPQRCDLSATVAEGEAQAPTTVWVGAYLNDIQSIDLRNHTFLVDFYFWFRWCDNEISPGESFEFMNVALSEAEPPELINDVEDVQPDGMAYRLYRYRGAFSTKFPVGAYPFDTQRLRIEIEDADWTIDRVRYQVEELTLNQSIELPGYRITNAAIELTDHPYATTFGDRLEAAPAPYSRATIAITVQRPWLESGLKTLTPVLLIIFCAAAALLLGGHLVEARTGLAITSLLALVALQFTMAGSLPEVGYLLMLDQIYIASYAFILVVVAAVVLDARDVARIGERGAVRAPNMPFAFIAISLYLAATTTIVWLNLRPLELG